MMNAVWELFHYQYFCFMQKSIIYLFIPVFLLSCKGKGQKIKPVIEPVSESVYASGIVKSRDQYEAFATANGIIENIYVSENDPVKKGSPILSISNETQRLNKEIAELSAGFSDFDANRDKLQEAGLLITLSRDKMKNDSLMYSRQKYLWQQQVGSAAELEQRELAWQNSRTAYFSSVVRYNDLKRQLSFNSSQSKKNLLISKDLTNDYVLRSEIDGIVYSINKTKGEIVNAQTPLAVIGAAKQFVLEMQVDEYDILKVREGQPVLVTLDSYKGKVFEAKVTKINPMMNERSKTFLVKAEFVSPPAVLYPNISFEANIVLESKAKALLIPRNYILDDSVVFKSNGDKVIVKTGLRDYQKIEIISGITAEDELINPAP